MNKYLDKIVHKAKTTLSQTTANVKERIFALTNTSSASVQEIADYIRLHPDTKQNQMDLLGHTYSFSHLYADGIHYYLETKHSYVLQLDVHIANDTIVSYRSYRDKYSLKTPIKFPNLTTH